MKKSKKLLCSVIAVLMLLSCLCVFSGCSKNEEKFVWNDIKLKDYLPEPPTDTGKTVINSETDLSLDVDNISESQFSEYVTACKEKGYTIDSESRTGDNYEAYNQDGYKLRLMYYSNSTMDISLKAPEKMEEIEWPDSDLGKVVPVPKSNMGKFNYEYEDKFSVLIGNTSEKDFKDYIKKCSESGFKVDYDKDDTYYRAYNDDGFYISVDYEGNNLMNVEAKLPKEESSEPESSIEESSKQESSEPESSIEESSKEEPSKQESSKQESKKPESSKADSGLVTPSFKEAMDSYEKFFDEYIAFMKKYKESENPLDMMSEYSDYMTQYAETMQKMSELEDEELSDADTAYYIEVTTRINKKLLEVAQ